MAGEGTYPITWNETSKNQGNTTILGHNFQSSPVPYGASATTEPRLISSYHQFAGLDAPGRAANGVLIDPPNPGFHQNVYARELGGGTTWNEVGAGSSGTYTWPLGPGEQEEPVYMDDGTNDPWSVPINGGGWLTNAMAVGAGLKGKSTTISGAARSTSSSWPSFTNGPSIRNKSNGADGAWLPGYGEHSVTGQEFEWNQYEHDNQISGYLGTVNNETLIEPQGWDGLNHFWKPAIWDRGDGPHGGEAYNWTKETIFRLGGAWYDYAAGRRVHWSWPLTTSWKRWFFDKAGAARGYSGAGI